MLQAQHNMLVHLGKPPNALNLRRILDGQRIVSHEAARRAPEVAPELIEKWLQREQTYQALVDETRNLGGLVGDGGPQQPRPPTLSGGYVVSTSTKSPMWHPCAISTALHPDRRPDRLHHRGRSRRAALLHWRQGAPHRRSARSTGEPSSRAVRPNHVACPNRSTRDHQASTAAASRCARRPARCPREPRGAEGVNRPPARAQACAPCWAVAAAPPSSGQSSSKKSSLIRLIVAILTGWTLRRRGRT